MDLIELKLTPRELTHIRVAMLHRLDALGTGEQTEQTIKAYEECMALILDGGKLHVAMRQSREIAR